MYLAIVHFCSEKDRKWVKFEFLNIIRAIKMLNVHKLAGR